jgi:ubiquinone/menaquinone biosynthesis C-methylase UbiE
VLRAGTSVAVQDDASATSAVVVCPKCRAPLEAVGTEQLQCVECGAMYPLRAGIPSFCEGEHFYDTYLDEHCPYVADPPRWKARLLRVLPYWSWREWKFFRRHLLPGMTVLDLGCARGKEWFISAGSVVVGVDPTLAPLAECAEHYDLVAQAQITRLPFADATFDVVVTSHVLGHVALAEKDAALAEIARVLRPGGLSLNIIETDSKNRFVEFGKSDQELYRINFIETDGHVGLELPSATIGRFCRHGFSVVQVEKMESGIVHARYFQKYLGKGYPDRAKSVRSRIALWERIQRNRVLLAAYEVAMGSYHAFVEPWRTSLDDAMFIGLAARKNPS